MGDGVRDRVRVQLSAETETCPRCGEHELRLMRSRDVRAGRARLNPFWDAHEKTYERCTACGFRRRADDDVVAASAGRPTSSRAEPDRPPRRVLTALGWTAVALMVVLIAVLTAVLAGLLLVVSVWVAVAVPLVVLLLVVGVVAFARRSG